MHEAAGTLTHAALEAMRGETVFLGQGKRRSVAFLGWPAPGSVERDAPVKKARELYSLYEAFHDQLFPEFETGKLYAGLDFTADIPLAVRVERVKQLAVRHGEDPEAVARGLFGNPTDVPGAGSLDSRARWFYHNPERQAEAFIGKK